MFGTRYFLFLAGCSVLHATVTITSITSPVSSPQVLGTPIVLDVSATDTNPGPLTFQFSTAYQGGSYTVVRNFNIGTLSGSNWNSQPFSWAEITAEGAYTFRVIAKDFTSGEKTEQTFPFTLTALASGGQMKVVSTPNSLVALAGVPPCPLGSSVRVLFASGAGSAGTATPYQSCTGTLSSNFYLGGMHVSTSYTVKYEIQTGSTITQGANTAKFTSGPLPADVLFPNEVVLKSATPDSDVSEKIVLHSFTITAPTSKNYQPLATDLAGLPIWYYDGGPNDFALLTRPEANGTFLLQEAGPYWGNGSSQEAELVRLIDLTGNVLRETNAGLMSQQLIGMGATDLQLCSNILLPAAVGSACMPGFTHDLIELPNGDFATLAYVEKIFPPGTQGDKTGLNVDIVGNAIVVIDQELNVVWFWDAFQHDGGGNQLNINRPAVLGETCSPTEGGARCDPLFLVGTSGVTKVANDWLHGNTIQYLTTDGNLLYSSRHQDWVMKIDFSNGAGTGDILWRMGVDGDFTFNNINSDPYPWFSGQHDAGFEANGVFDCFDNGNTRVTKEGSGNSRGMVLSVDETTFTVTPVLSQDLGYYGFALGSAQLLANGNYHFQPGVVSPYDFSFSIEYLPTPGTTSGTSVFNLKSEFGSYRSFRMHDLYTPPTT